MKQTLTLPAIDEWIIDTQHKINTLTAAKALKGEATNEERLALEQLRMVLRSLTAMKKSKLEE